MHRSYLTPASLSLAPLTSARAGLVVTEVAGPPTGSQVLIQSTGNASIFNNGSSPKSTTQWETFDPNNLITDDYLAGETYTSLGVASGGVLPLNVGKDMFLRWDLSGDARQLHAQRTNHRHRARQFRRVERPRLPARHAYRLPAANPDADALPNRLEYALASDPLAASPRMCPRSAPRPDS